MDFPLIRMRRLRRSEPMRALVRETRLHPGALIAPMFICPGEGVRRAISSMPGVFNLSIDQAIQDAIEAARLGIGGFLLFGLPATKDEQASGAWDQNGIVQQALRAMKRERGSRFYAADRRCLPLRIYVARSLRHCSRDCQRRA